MRARSTTATISALFLATLALGTVACESSAKAAPPAPSGPHPRILLNAPTLAALKGKLGDPTSGAAKAVAHCDAIVANPTRFNSGVHMGYGFAFNGSACALAFQLTGNAGHRTQAVRYLNALLDDQETVGDRSGGNEVAKRDAGYAIRYHGFASLLYDWLPGAPGVDVAKTRARVKYWIDEHTRDGYLKDMPGSNMHAGFVSAKTFAAIAFAGEEPAAATYWTQAVDDIFGKQIKDKGLGATGIMKDGDWPEGWEYAPFSLVGYGLAWRAAKDHGASFPEIDQFFDDVVPAYRHTFFPDKKFGWTGGDWGEATLYATISRRSVLGSLLGGKDPTRAAWGSALLADKATGAVDECLMCEAIAETRSTTPVDYVSTKPATFYLARGTRNLYARSSWDADAFFTVFTSAPRLGPDHQHFNASSFVLVRGGDHLIADPSPYGSLSTFTGNAMAVDSQTVEPDYRPGQGHYGRADLPWARGFESGVVAARADISMAFRDYQNKTDVPFAKRDYAFLPNGEIITIDRARTDAAARGMSLRWRSTAKLTVNGEGARGSVGASELVIHSVARSGGTPEVVKVAPISRTCQNGAPFNNCVSARFPVDEYRFKVPGPSALAVTVFDGLKTGEAAATTTDITKIDAKNTGVVGVEVVRGSRTVMVASSAKDGASGAELAYVATGDGEARHIVFDAPETDGKSNVAATAEGAKCSVKITPGPGLVGRPLVFRVAPAAQGCTVTEEKGVALQNAPPGTNGPGGPGDPNNPNGPGDPNNPNGPGSAANSDPSGCACDVVGSPSSTTGLGVAGSALFAAAVLGIVSRASRRRQNK